MAAWHTVIRPWEAEGRRLWEETDASARQIAEWFGVTKNVVIGVAHRRGWKRRRHAVAVHTLSERLGWLHARMDAVMDRYGAVR